MNEILIAITLIISAGEDADDLKESLGHQQEYITRYLYLHGEM